MPATGVLQRGVTTPGKAYVAAPKDNTLPSLLHEAFKLLEIRFANYDHDGAETLMYKELERELSIIGFTKADVLFDLFKKVDYDGNGTLDFAEFLSLMAWWGQHGEYTWFFRNPTNAGVVKQAFAVMGDALRAYDTNKDNQLSYTEFVNFISQYIPDPAARAVVDEHFGSSGPGTEVRFPTFMFLLYRIMARYPDSTIKGMYKGMSDKGDKDFSSGTGENSQFWKELTRAFSVLEEDFIRFDKDKNRLVDFTEITQAIPVTTAGYGKLDILTRLEHAFCQVDIDGNRTLDFYEFMYLCFMMTQNGAYHDLVAESTGSKIVKGCFINIHKFYRKFDADGNLRLTLDELENFCRAEFGMMPPTFPQNFDVVKYKSAATQGRDACDVVRFMKLLYMTVCPTGQFHPDNYDPNKSEAVMPVVQMISIPKPKQSARPPRFTNIEPRKFVKTKLLGQGGQGTVHLGTYEGTAVAGKTLLSNPSQELVDETMEEVNFFIQLDHPNCHYLLGAKTTLDNGGIMLLTEVCESGSLFDLYGKQGRKFDMQTAHRLARECAVGFDVIHNMGFMHRDIKSLNVFLSKDMVAKVADFGMCTNVSTSTDPCGTPQWMAPEVLANYFGSESYYDKRVDVYSYSILAWEIFHCKIPYGDTGLDQMGVARAVLQENRRPPLSRACPPPIQSIITKCWNKDPKSRPTFAEVISMLDAAAPSCGV
eukprot:CAMPEP_0181297642 /NCGR_PEP_ID=MMETSP1101-20121128/5351_1 /TAXON_ID=46948 /ORGANISM="Rhodomonas abbreviata, Strain Caron Lab Isolate" /LENGTH=705 /DNA_ID=CAMNT_0023402597 /DNA_START=27 /DNA_END=2144 /DNA_ORIENTATION=-